MFRGSVQNVDPQSGPHTGPLSGPLSGPLLDPHMDPPFLNDDEVSRLSGALYVIFTKTRFETEAKRNSEMA